jgi:hypothetical protein
MTGEYTVCRYHPRGGLHSHLLECINNGRFERRKHLQYRGPYCAYTSSMLNGSRLSRTHVEQIHTLLVYTHLHVLTVQHPSPPWFFHPSPPPVKNIYFVYWGSGSQLQKDIHMGAGEGGLVINKTRPHSLCEGGEGAD